MEAADFGRWILKVILSIVIIGVATLGYQAVKGFSNVWANALGLVLVAVFLVVALAINPGKENILDFLPVLLIDIAVIGLIGALWINAPFSIALEGGLQGIAIGVASVVLAHAVVEKFS